MSIIYSKIKRENKKCCTFGHNYYTVLFTIGVINAKLFFT